jgi:hypothetical protein
MQEIKWGQFAKKSSNYEGMLNSIGGIYDLTYFVELIAYVQISWQYMTTNYLLHRPPCRGMLRKPLSFQIG